MFDPYHKWLGIPLGQRPPTYYQLLGIAPDEQDPDVIEAAAVRQSAYVRNFQTSPHARACSQILNEIAQARLTLRDTAKRSAYDVHTAKASSAPEALPGQAIARRAVATPPDAFRQNIVEPDVLGRAKSRSKRLGRGTRRTLLATLLTFSFISVAIVFVAAAIFRSHFPSGWARLVSPSGGQVNKKWSVPGGKVGARKSPSQEHFERGMVLISKKEYVQALSEFSEAIRFDPKFAEAYHRRGVCHRNTNEFDKAISDFSKALELGRAGSYAERGDAYYHKGDREKALADLDKAIQFDPRNHWAYWVKSWVMESKGDYRAAIACLDQAIGIAPSREYRNFRDGMLHRLNNERHDASTGLRRSEVSDGTSLSKRPQSLDGGATRPNRLVTLRPDDIIAHWRFEEGSPNAAAIGKDSIIDTSGNGLHGSPVNRPVYRQSVRAGAEPKSARKDRLALDFNGKNQSVFIPDSPLFHLTHSLTLEATVNVRSTRPGHAMVLMFRGDDRAELDPYVIKILPSGQMEFRICDAEGRSEVLTEPVPGFSRWFHVAGTLDGDTGEMKLYIDGRLVKSGKTTIRPIGVLDALLNPGLGIGNVQSPSYDLYLDGMIEEVRISNVALQPSQFLGQEGEKTRNQRLLASAPADIGSSPARSDAAEVVVTPEGSDHLKQGDRLAEKGDFDGAIAEYSEAIRVVPQFVTAYIQRGSAYRSKGELDKSIDDYSLVLRINPRLAEVYRLRGIVSESKGQLDSAIADYSEAIRLDPNDIEALDRRGWAYHVRGALNKAILDYTEAIRVDPKYAFAYFHRGYAHEKKGDLKRAFSNYSEAIRRDAGCGDAYYRRSWLYWKIGKRILYEQDRKKALQINPKLVQFDLEYRK